VHCSQEKFDVPYPDVLDMSSSYSPPYNANAIYAFENKKSCAVFRGGPHGFPLRRPNGQLYPRFQIAKLSQKYPVLLDAGVTSGGQKTIDGTFELSF
jgi:hypothetical protein